PQLLSCTSIVSLCLCVHVLRSLLHPPVSTLVPYTTLFRSRVINDVEQTKDFIMTGLMNVWLDLVTIIIALVIMIVTKSNQTFIRDRKSTRLNSSHVSISYAVFCLKKKRTADGARSRSKSEQ